jgi:hypothetical protein
MRGVDRYLLRKDIAEELHDWVFFSGSSDKVYGFKKVTDGKDSYYEVPFISDFIKGFIMVDTPRSISLMAKRCDGKEFNKRFRTADDAKTFLTHNCMRY